MTPPPLVVTDEDLDALEGTLLSGDVIAAELRELRKEVDKWASLDGDATPHVRRSRWLLVALTKGVQKASERYMRTLAASRLTGWDVGTLQKYARRALSGSTLPRGWEALRVKRQGKHGYSFLISTIPVKGDE